MVVAPYLTGLGSLEERGTVLSGAVVVARATVGSGGVVEISHGDEASRAADVRSLCVVMSLEGFDGDKFYRDRRKLVLSSGGTRISKKWPDNAR